MRANRGTVAALFSIAALPLGVWLGMGNLEGTAQAQPDNVDQSGVEVLEPGATSCPTRGAICFTTGASSTVESTAVTATTVSRFNRVTTGRKDAIDDSVPWTVTINANLRLPALTGNALFLVFDAGNPRAISEHEVTGMWQARIRAGSQVLARLTLSPDDGFHADHTYHVRVSQIINNKEVVLADGDVKLQ